MLNVDRYEATARLLARQRLSATLIDPAQDLRPRDENEAYALQALVNRQLTASGLGLTAGHKIGCTTPVMQAFLNIPSPCAGEIFAATVLRNNARLRRAAYVRLGVECEIVVALSQDLAPESAPFTRDRVASAVGAVIAGIEIVDDRYRDYRSLGAPTLIADNFFNAGCVLGDPVEDWRKLNLAALAGRMLINGEEVGRGDGAMVLGHPLEALVWLANARASRGRGLQRGKFVFLGSLVETKWLNVGDSVRIEVEALGALDIAVLP
jgi:2-keto-4-pentenoate hydratase